MKNQVVEKRDALFSDLPKGRAMDELKRQICKWAVEKYNGDVKKAAGFLGITPATVSRFKMSSSRDLRFPGEET